MNIAREWNLMDGERRREIVASCRWVTREGNISRTGQRIAQSFWQELTPDAQNVIARMFGRMNEPCRLDCDNLDHYEVQK